MQHNDWVNEELNELRLGDQRLDKRAKEVLRGLAQRPGEHVQGAFQARAERAGAYRLLRHEQIDFGALLQSHTSNTLERARAFERVLCISDTSFIAYPHRDPIEGMGPFNQLQDNGFFLHVNFAVSEEGICLGTLKAHTYTRDRALDKKGTQARRPLHQKESQRWVGDCEHVQHCQEALQHSGAATRLVYVTDREGDFYELLACANNGHADYLIRSQGDRLLPNGQRIGERPKELQRLGRTRFELPARRGLKPRTLTQSIYSAQVDISALRNGKRTEAVQSTVLWLMEDEPPQGEKPVNWVLMSNLPVTTLAEALELLRWYRLRWRVEMLFDALKNTCKVERLRLQSLTSIEKLCALHLLVAWRVLYLMTLGREHCDLPASTSFDEEELQVLSLTQKLTTPRKAPRRLDTLGIAMEVLALLGGYEPRKNGPPPGLHTLARGYARLLDFVTFKSILSPQ